MKNLLMVNCLLFVSILHSNAQVSVNTTGAPPDNSAMLDISDTTKGILVPRMTQAQRLAIVSPANGLLVYQTGNSTFYVNRGTSVAPFWDFLTYPNNNPFTRNVNLVSNTGYSSDEGFLFGSNAYPDGNNSNYLSLMLFARYNSAFRVGTIPDHSSAWNYENLASYSFAANFNTRATAQFSTAFGVETEAAGGSSFGMGERTKALGYASLSAGYHTIANSFSSTAIGMYNDTVAASRFAVVPTDPIFTVGIGTADNARKNAITVLKNGRMGIGDIVPASQLHLGGGPNDWNKHIRLDNDIAGTEYGVILYDGEIRFRNFKAGAGFAFRNSANTTVATLSSTGALTIASTLTQSDARLKKNIQHLTGTDSKLSLLNGYTYNWKDGTMDNSTQFGLLAQEVEEQFPELVKEDDKGVKSVNYIGLIPVLLEALKSQEKALQSQQQKIEALERKLSK